MLDFDNPPRQICPLCESELREWSSEHGYFFQSCNSCPYKGETNNDGILVTVRYNDLYVLPGREKIVYIYNRHNFDKHVGEIPGSRVSIEDVERAEKISLLL